MFDWTIAILAFLCLPWCLDYLIRHDPDPATWDDQYVEIGEQPTPTAAPADPVVQPWPPMQVIADSEPASDVPAQSYRPHRGELDSAA